MTKLFALVLFAFLLFTTEILQAQYEENEKRCSTFELTEKYKKEIPGYIEQLEKNEKIISEWINNRPNYKTRNVVTIPVVVHLLYNPDSLANQYLSDWQITSQIDAMNEDFRRENADAYKTPSVFLPSAADCEIQFCLAQRDPNGNPTIGIIRKQTSVRCFNDFSSMKTEALGDTGWSYKNYLNIWVCCLSGGALGYSTIPGNGINDEDGCVMHYKAFGRVNTFSKKYNRGRDGTHEVGHWLNLIHTWGDANCGDDKVNDTPVQKDYNFSCPAFPHTNSCPGSTPNGEMFMNYMDYTNDSCMNIFTHGQKQRMFAALNIFRPTILSSNGCDKVSLHPLDIGISSIPQPKLTTQTLIPIVTLTNFGSDTVTSAKIYYSHNYGSALQSYSWNGTLVSGASIDVTLPAMKDSIGYQIFVAYTKNPNGQNDQDTSNDFKTRSYYVHTPLGVNEHLLEGGSFNNYPNPNDGEFEIQFGNLLSKAEVQIINSIGQNVFTKTFIDTKKTFQLSLRDLAEGIYFIKVISQEGIQTKKFLVQ